MEMMLRYMREKTKNELKAMFRFLRNQEPKEKDVPNLSLSDYIAPESSGLTDYIGAFVVTADLDKEGYRKIQ